MTTAKILIIEDNEANLELMCYLLRATGYAPLCATDGQHGLEMVQLYLPDLVLCDVQVPKMNGYQIIAKLKSSPALCVIPVVAVTALAMVGDSERILAAGFDGYMAKPIDPELFVSEVQAFLQHDPLTVLAADACLSNHEMS